MIRPIDLDQLRLILHIEQYHEYVNSMSPSYRIYHQSCHVGALSGADGGERGAGQVRGGGGQALLAHAHEGAGCECYR